MTNKIISIFAIYDATGREITRELQLSQAAAIRAYSGCIIKFQAFKKAMA